MNTSTTHTEDRYDQLARTNARWRLLAVSSITLMAGVVIGGMGGISDRQPAQTVVPKPADPKAVVGYAGTEDTIFRMHQDGSISYLRIPKGERTAKGFFTWGDVKIDPEYTSRTMPQP